MHRISFVTTLVLLAACLGCRDGKRYHDMSLQEETVQLSPLEDIRRFQQEMNALFMDPEDSPFTDAERQRFKGHDFFVADTSFRVMAYLERTPDTEPFLMPTTTTRQALERVYGILEFQINGEVFELEVYQNQDLSREAEFEDYLFLPFLDETNGEDTYAGGRYIDLSIPGGDSLLVDFNKAYNPYCVYNEKYSCPIVPLQNSLPIRVEAGVKDYKK